jgi:hypothetical protein
MGNKGRGRWTMAALAVAVLLGGTAAPPAAGFALGRVSTVVDITREFLGEVTAQSPAAGTLKPPGTAVAVAIGKAGGKCL